MLALLSLLALLRLLLTLFAACQLLHLTLQLFSFPAKHFLLPALLRGLLFALLLRQFLLTASQLLQPSQRIVHGLLLLLSRGLLTVFVLILFGIQLQVEHVFKIAAGTTTATTATLLAERNLNLTERGFGTQQVLQCFLFGRQSTFELLAFQLFRRRAHCLDRLLHIFREALKGRIVLRQLPRLHTGCQRLRLIPQLALHIRQILGIVSRGRLFLAFQLIPGGGNHFLLAFGNLLLFFTLPLPLSAAGLRLRILFFKRLRFNEVDIGTRGSTRVAGAGVDADNIARHQLVVFEVQRGAAIRFFPAFAVQERDSLLIAAIYGVVQLQAL